VKQKPLKKTPVRSKPPARPARPAPPPPAASKRTRRAHGAEGTIVLAFSGGLDTTFLVLWLKEQTGADVVTVTVDTGGFRKGELDAIAARAKALG
jgi:tRNA(Ile)-lysidine synthase TilS/MesJ